MKTDKQSTFLTTFIHHSIPIDSAFNKKSNEKILNNIKHLLKNQSYT